MGKRDNGTGTIRCIKGANGTRYYAYAPARYTCDEGGSVRCVRESLGVFRKRSEARAALEEYARHPTAKYRHTLADVFEEWKPQAYADITQATQNNYSAAWNQICNAQPDVTSKPMREVTTGATFTLVGDLMQGVHEEEGIRSFAEWTKPVFHGEVALHQLTTSYRSTVEIMERASRVAAHHPVPGQLCARPVLRHGEPPRLYPCGSEADRIARLAELAQGWMQEGYHSIAIIEKTRTQANKTWRALKRLLPVRLLREGDTDYAGGLLVLPAALAKGLEFDCVIAGDCGASVYPDDAFLCRVLYVLMTRPLHHLALVYTGAPSPLLDAM